MRRLIRAIVDWAYNTVPIGQAYGNVIEDLQGGDFYDIAASPVVFCRARPGVPGLDPEHIHQCPYSEADRDRYHQAGWQVSNEECIIPTIEFKEVNGDPPAKPLEVVDELVQYPTRTIGRGFP